MTIPSGTQTLTSAGRLGGTVEKFLVEMALSILVVLAHLSADSASKLSSAISAKPVAVLAAAYTAATLVSVIIINHTNTFDCIYAWEKLSQKLVALS